jgi:hypothetical protein
MIRRVIVILVVGIVTQAMAQEKGVPCEQSKIIVDRCFVVHGRLSVANGDPDIRIWKIGTNRVLGVVDGAGQAETENVLPAQLRTIVGGAEPNPEDTVWADFKVCPQTRSRPGWMQMVCLKSAAHVFLVSPQK